jgi:MFS family permease
MLPLEEPADPRFPRVRGAVLRTFGSLNSRNYRLFFGGELVSYIGSWMQTMAEAWLVLSLTGNGVAVGATFACRFLPVALFGLWGGAVADRFDRRKVLITTQLLMAILAVALWLIVWTGVVHTWMVFALAIALGFVTVVDEPARHAFVEEMVGRDRVANAVALNGAVANSARITGPALAGVLIATVGTAWVFFVNAASFFAVVAALLAMRAVELQRPHRHTERPRVREGIAYAWSLTDIRATIVLVAVVGTLVYNFPTFLTLAASDTFHGGAGLAGFLMAVLGVGTVIGGLAAAHRGHSTAPGGRRRCGAGRVARRDCARTDTAAVRSDLGACRRDGGVLRYERQRAHATVFRATSPWSGDGHLHAVDAGHNCRGRTVRRMGVPAVQPARRHRSGRLCDVVHGTRAGGAPDDCGAQAYQRVDRLTLRTSRRTSSKSSPVNADEFPTAGESNRYESR